MNKILVVFIFFMFIGEPSRVFAESKTTVKELVTLVESGSTVAALKKNKVLQNELFEKLLYSLADFFPNQLGTSLVANKDSRISEGEYVERRYHTKKDQSDSLVIRIFPYSISGEGYWDNVQGTEKCKDGSIPAMDAFRNSVKVINVGDRKGSIGLEPSISGKTFVTLVVCVKGSQVNLSLLTTDDIDRGKSELAQYAADFPFSSLEKFSSSLEEQ